MQDSAQKLLNFIEPFDQVVIAFSGGVDSAVVACAANKSIGNRAIAVTALSPSVPSGEVDAAAKLASALNLRHQVINTFEIENPNYVQNSGDRCYWCKNELYDQIKSWATENLNADFVIFNGTNTDDLGDYRPGLKSAADHDVVSPLVECQISKQGVRSVAKLWNLPVWNKPAGPCLASRVAPGQAVTIKRLSLVDKSESYLHQLGFPIVRVRYHEGDLARVEVPFEQLEVLREVEPQVRSRLMSLGFQSVEIDEEGFRSGKLNDLIPLVGITK